MKNPISPARGALLAALVAVSFASAAQPAPTNAATPWEDAVAQIRHDARATSEAGTIPAAPPQAFVPPPEWGRPAPLGFVGKASPGGAAANVDAGLWETAPGNVVTMPGQANASNIP